MHQELELENRKISAIVLAAGLSQRMGTENKLTKKWRGRPLLQWTLHQLPYDIFDQVVVISGHDAESLLPIVAPYPVHTIHNPLYATGMSTSIATGMRNLADQKAVLICLGDMPAVTESDYRIIVSQFQATGASIAIPTWQGQDGHPVLFSRKHFAALQSLTPQDRGARELIEKENPNEILRIVMHTNGCIKDLDTKVDFLDANK